MVKRAEKATADKPGKTVETITKTREVLGEGGGEIDLEGARDDDGAVAEIDPMAKLEELGGGTGARYVVHRTSPIPYDGYVGSYGFEELSHERLQEEWGGGKFRISCREPSGKIKGSVQVVIAGKAKHKGDGTQAPVIASAAAPAFDMAAVMTAITAQANKQSELMTSLLTAVLTKKDPAPPPQQNLLEVLAAAKGLFKQGDGGADSVKLLLQGIELGKSFGEAGGDSSMADVFMKGLDTVKGAVLATQVRAPAPPRAAAAPRIAQTPATAPADPVQSAASSGSSAAPTEEARQMEWLRKQVAFLVHQAKRGKDAQLYAELFLDNLPDFLPAEKIRETFASADALDQLSFVFPDIASHREWFEKFRLEVLQFIADAEEGDDDEQPADAPQALPDDMPGADPIDGGSGE